MNKQPLVLLDARGLMLRSFYGSSDTSLTDSKGGTMSSWMGGLNKFLEDTLDPILSGGIAPSRVIACWDAGNNYRRARYPDYKSKRREKELDPLVAVEVKTLEEKLKRLLAYIGVRSCWAIGQEADDLLALFVEKLEYSHCTIWSGDKDMIQLVSQNVSLVRGGEVVSA